MPKKPFFTLFFVSWMVFVTLLSLFHFPEETEPFFVIPYFDKIVHFGFYFGASVLGSLSLRERYAGNKKLLKTLITIALLCVIYGIIIEVLQEKLTTYRDGNIYDVLANTTGAVAGAVLVWYVFAVWRKFPWKN